MQLILQLRVVGLDLLPRAKLLFKVFFELDFALGFIAADDYLGGLGFSCGGVWGGNLAATRF